MKTILFLFFTIAVFFCTSIFAQTDVERNIYGLQNNAVQYLRLSAVTDEANFIKTDDFNNIPHTTGKRFLMNTWSKGSNMLNDNNQPIDISQYLFNYDMLTGNMVVTENKAKLMSIAPTRVKTITLKNSGKDFPFVHVPVIDSNRFFLRLSGSDSLYTLYKECKVKFVKSDYRNDGLIQTGNPDDQYIDISLYYITLPNENTFRQISFKPKEIKNLLVSEKETVSKYFNVHSDDEITEAFLTGLINQINEKGKQTGFHNK